MKNLIPISYLNEVCFLSLNTDDKKYTMCLKMSQGDLSDMLGSTFYDEIYTQYPGTLSADNIALYEGYIKDLLAWQTYFNYLKFANIDATPTGIREFSDDNSTLASDIRMASLEKNILREVEKYKGRMITFLRFEKSNDQTKYPLYQDRCSNEEYSFAITSVHKSSDTLFRANKSIITNE
jgi:hypothetical protein